MTWNFVEPAMRFTHGFFRFAQWLTFINFTLCNVFLLTEGLVVSKIWKVSSPSSKLYLSPQSSFKSLAPNTHKHKHHRMAAVSQQNAERTQHITLNSTQLRYLVFFSPFQSNFLKEWIHSSRLNKLFSQSTTRLALCIFVMLSWFKLSLCLRWHSWQLSWRNHRP